jgi:hypothetical protein
VFLAEYASNLQELEDLLARRIIMQRDEKIPVFAEISAQSARHGLEGLEFTAAEARSADFGNTRFFETRARSSFSGGMDGIILFLGELLDNGGWVYSLLAVPDFSRDGMADFELEFSFFGGG